MKAIIYEEHIHKNYFLAQMGGRILCFYLTKTDMKKYKDVLQNKAIVDFELLDQRKTIDKRICMRISHFNTIQIRGKRGLQTLFDIKDVRRDMLKVMWRFKYLLFIDVEMSMPSYYHSGTYQPEIIQVGYILTDNNLNIIKKDAYYIKPAFGRFVSKRTLKFLNIERDVFFKAKDYDHFYNDLKAMMKRYKPKLIVWGKNDILALQDSYTINQKDALTTSRSFINLLQVHKNYFNLQSDLGLFKAYETYYGNTNPQEHDAYTDALVMMDVFKRFRLLK